MIFRYGILLLSVFLLAIGSGCLCMGLSGKHSDLEVQKVELVNDRLLEAGKFDTAVDVTFKRYFFGYEDVRCIPIASGTKRIFITILELPDEESPDLGRVQLEIPDDKSWEVISKVFNLKCGKNG